MDVGVNRRLFEELPVSKALLSLALPTVVSQLITTIYNLADTFWVGRLGDPDQLAALAMVFPVQILITASGNLFGIGGGTCISRALGAKDEDGVKNASIFAMYGGAITALALIAFLTFCRTASLRILGVTPRITGHMNAYLNIVIVAGGLPSVLNLVLANMLRSEGFSKQASVGLSGGGILNMILDPFFVLPAFLDMEIKGAAIATLLSNLATTVYFAALLYRRRREMVFSLRPQFLSAARSVGKNVITSGLPSALHMLLSAVSNTVLNSLIIGYGEAAQAAVGITKKIDAIPLGALVGLAQSSVPLIAYSYGAGNRDRMMSAFKTTVVYCMCASLVILALIETFAGPIVGVFISDAETVAHGTVFLRLHCISIPLMMITLLIISFFQATHESFTAFWISLIRKGILDVPLMYLLNAVYPMYGVIACQPIMDVVSCAAAVVLFLRWQRKKSDTVPVKG